MDKQYFNMEYVKTFKRTFWFMLMLKLFGKKIQERAGDIVYTWYIYKGKIYLIDCKAWYLY